MIKLTQEKMDRICELLKDRPQCRLVYWDDMFGKGYTIEITGVGTLHPLAFLDLIENPEPEGVK